MLDTNLVIGIFIGILLTLTFLLTVLTIIYLAEKLFAKKNKQKTLDSRTKKPISAQRSASLPQPISRPDRQPITHKPADHRRDESIELNDKFKKALSLIDTGASLFITGKPGTGKSTLLRYFAERTNKRVALLAPTGIAALNIRGSTIHSFFKFPPKAITSQDIRQLPDPTMYERVDAIVIDEISMVRADLMDAIDCFLRLNGRVPTEPFGGTQMIFFGDIYQLPPVVVDTDEHLFLNDQYESPFFFNSRVFNNIKIPVVRLEKIYRQTDEQFIRILNAIRLNTLTIDLLQELNNRVIPNFQPEEGWITLTPTNDLANSINSRRLEEMPGQEFIFEGTIEGKFPAKLLPTLPQLKLKPQAQVMFVKNDINKRWVNGTIGKISELGENHIQVVVSREAYEHVFNVQKEKWDILRYEYDPVEGQLKTEVTGSFTQYPLKLAWAVTIHKSQGLTFDNVCIDLSGGTFAHGQAYVALSRCRSLNGIVLKRNFQFSDIQLDNRVQDSFDYIPFGN